jgi:phospho-N-acetylmuramoyl-pentapeptide-transferase
MLARFLLHFQDIAGINVLKYITFRTALAGITALLITLLLGPKLISFLKSIKAAQPILGDAPKSHQDKQGTPTMGGLLIIFSILTASVMWVDLANPSVLICLGTLMVFGVVGFLDDYKKLMKKDNLGLKPKQKIFLMLILSLVIAILVIQFDQRGPLSLSVSFPFFKDFHPYIGLWMIPWIMLVIIGTSNGVNLTDGLDGLAAGTIVIAASAFTLLTYVASNIKLATYLAVPYVASVSELTVIMGAVAGAALGFLWFNAHPAEIFMGDTGSLSIGALLGTTAVLIKQEIIILLVGGIFFLESLSVILQVGSFRLRKGRRIFRMAPFHHHLELSGLPETKVVIRLWIVAIVLCLLGLSSLKLR